MYNYHKKHSQLLITSFLLIDVLFSNRGLLIQIFSRSLMLSITRDINVKLVMIVLKVNNNFVGIKEDALILNVTKIIA